MKNSDILTVGIVDDDAGTRDRVRELLESQQPPINLVEWSNLEALQKDPSDVDLILLDLHLPGYDGMETLKAAKEIVGSVPIVILTGTQPYQFGLSALDEGAENFLSKNHWSDEDILNKVTSTVKQHRDMEAIRNYHPA